jgi:hypothetical protein
MNKFLNFQFIKRAVSLTIYFGLLIVMISNMFRYSQTGDHSQVVDSYYLNWWTLFLVLDMWFFGGKGKDSKD